MSQALISRRRPMRPPLDRGEHGPRSGHGYLGRSTSRPGSRAGRLALAVVGLWRRHGEVHSAVKCFPVGEITIARASPRVERCARSRAARRRTPGSMVAELGRFRRSGRSCSRADVRSRCGHGVLLPSEGAGGVATRAAKRRAARGASVIPRRSTGEADPVAQRRDRMVRSSRRASRRPTRRQRFAQGSPGVAGVSARAGRACRPRGAMNGADPIAYRLSTQRRSCRGGEATPGAISPSPVSRSRGRWVVVIVAQRARLRVGDREGAAAEPDSLVLGSRPHAETRSRGSAGAPPGSVGVVSGTQPQVSPAPPQSAHRAL
jgi:hypothetical protein